MSSFKYGRRRDLLSLDRPAVKLGDHLTGVVPSHPASDDNLAALSNWQMLGNDQYGDCVAVTWANVRRLVTTKLSVSEYPNINEVITFYKTQNPNFPADDNGMDIQTALQDLVDNGGPDGKKAVAFAKVDHTNVDEVKAAVALFGYVWVGIVVYDNNENEFSAGQPWTFDPNANQMGGHSVVSGGYGYGTGVLAGDEKFITWAAETSFTDGYWSNAVEEAWVVVWPEHLGSEEFLAGVNAAALEADYHTITGGSYVVPTPPAPTPPPIPTPVPPKPKPTPPPAPTPKPSWWDSFVDWIMDLFGA